MIKGKRKSLKVFSIPFITFWMSFVAFLNGRIFIKVIIPSLSPSVGNHIPDNTDCPAITMDETPPIDFSLQMVPRSKPNAIKNKDVIKLKRIDETIPIPNIDESNIIPTRKNNID